MTRKNNDLTNDRVKFQEDLVAQYLTSTPDDQIVMHKAAVLKLPDSKVQEYITYAKDCRSLVFKIIDNIKDYKIERYSNTDAELSRALTKKANSIKKFGKNQWNPADIWLFKTDSTSEITKLLRNNYDTNIEMFNSDVLELLKRKIIIPISLKLSNNPMLTYIDTIDPVIDRIVQTEISFWNDNSTKNIKGLKIGIKFGDSHNACISIYPKASSRDCAVSFCVDDQLYTRAPMCALKKVMSGKFDIKDETAIAKKFRANKFDYEEAVSLVDNFFNAINNYRASKNHRIINNINKDTLLKKLIDNTDTADDTAKLARIIYVSTKVIERLDLGTIHYIYRLGLKHTSEYCSRYQIS